MHYRSFSHLGIVNPPCTLVDRSQLGRYGLPGSTAQLGIGIGFDELIQRERLCNRIHLSLLVAILLAYAVDLSRSLLRFKELSHSSEFPSRALPVLARTSCCLKYALVNGWAFLVPRSCGCVGAEGMLGLYRKTAERPGEGERVEEEIGQFTTCTGVEYPPAVTSGVFGNHCSE